FPFEQVPRYLLRDRDAIFGSEFRKEVKVMGIKEVLSSPRSPWQRAYVERVIGTIRRECLDQVIVLNEASLYRHVKSFLGYYHESGAPLSTETDPPEPRPMHSPERGTRSCRTASWRASPPIRATRSLIAAVLAQFLLLDPS